MSGEEKKLIELYKKVEKLKKKSAKKTLATKIANHFNYQKQNKRPWYEFTKWVAIVYLVGSVIFAAGVLFHPVAAASLLFPAIAGALSLARLFLPIISNRLSKKRNNKLTNKLAKTEKEMNDLNYEMSLPRKKTKKLELKSEDLLDSESHDIILPVKLKHKDKKNNDNKILDDALDQLF